MTGAAKKWIHMVGIAGAGMSGIAKVLCEQGYKVSGSDLQPGKITNKLEELGVTVYKGHSSSNLGEGVDLVVISSAVPQDNVEVKLARDRNIPVLKRGQMLAHLVNTKKGIAVAGAHGKTTTTSMIYTILAEGGMDPSFIVGGELQGTDLNAKLGSGEYFVAEADESDASFLELKPYIAVVTNIEDDHLDYYKSFDNIRNAFKQFLKQINSFGLAVLFGGDECNRQIKDQIQARAVLYGEDPDYDYFLKNWQPNGLGSAFESYSKKEGYLGKVELSIPGKHNALNAMAGIAVARETGISMDRVRDALLKFQGARRRFQIMGNKGKLIVVDDYAHHPTEIKATIEAARNSHQGRLIVVFQPHRYSRTRILGRQLGEALVKADLVIITDVYSAGEPALEGVSGEIVFKAALDAGGNTIYIPGKQEIENYLLENSREGDLIITMGAGDIWQSGLNFLKKIPESVLKV
ncbi:MAG: UDP-N-acetylmuramate--L-alanine ligase [Syntrophomonas sp.]